MPSPAPVLRRKFPAQELRQQSAPCPPGPASPTAPLPQRRRCTPPNLQTITHGAQSFVPRFSHKKFFSNICAYITCHSLRIGCDRKCLATAEPVNRCGRSNRPPPVP